MHILGWHVPLPFNTNPFYTFNSITQSCLTLCDPMDCSKPDSLSIINSQRLLKLMSIKPVMPSNHLIFIISFSCLQSFPVSGSFPVSLFFTVSWTLPNSCPLRWWCHPTLLPSIFLSFRVFSDESALYIRWPKYWSFSFSISPYSEYARLISLKINQFDILAVQGILRSLIQHHKQKASILWCSAFFFVQLSHPSMTTGKSIA